MTYLQFHLVFTLPAILALKLAGPSLVSRDAIKATASLALIALIAFVYTTPWDNYLVEQGVWGYGAERVLAVVWHVPVEEYLFFVLQPLLTGLWLYRLIWHPAHTIRSGTASQTARVLGTLAFAGLGLLGYVLLAQPPTRYLALTLVWGAPMLALQWAYGGQHLWRLRRLVSWAVAVPTLYLWVADRIAIGLGIWSISEQFTVGWHLVGLPMEEAVFFLVTNLLVVQGLLLTLHTWNVEAVREPASVPA